MRRDVADPFLSAQQTLNHQVLAALRIGLVEGVPSNYNDWIEDRARFA